MKHDLDPEKLARRLTSDPDVIKESLFGHQVKVGNTDIDRFIHAVESRYIDWDITNDKFQDLFFRMFKAPSGTDIEIMAEVLLKTLQASRNSQNVALISKLMEITEKQLNAYKKVMTARAAVTSTPPQSTPSPSGGYPSSGQIHLKNGSVIDAVVIVDGARHPRLNPKLLWIGVDPKKTTYFHHRQTNQNGQIIFDRGNNRKRALPELYQFIGSYPKSFYIRPYSHPSAIRNRTRKNASNWKWHAYNVPYHIMTIKKDNIVNII